MKKVLNSAKKRAVLIDESNANEEFLEQYAFSFKNEPLSTANVVDCIIVV